ncbi:hypothetical protein ABW19_dt0203077 [Dactylella cylindrospora]|nr:hypothetical protein ABW19_dt0203077 [Dactylella cylindrospora]
MSSALSSHSETTVADMNGFADSQKGSIELQDRPQSSLPLVPERSHPSQPLPNDTKANSTSDGKDGQTKPEHEYPTGSALWTIIVALICAIFLISLDRTIISTAIPAITNEFNSLGDVGWYGSAYLLTSCGLLPLSGKLYTFYPVKWVFLAQICVFEIGSALCGWAPDSTSFIVGRAIAGAGGAGIFTGAIVMVTDAVPLHKRSTLMGSFGGIFGISSVVAPIMGGAFTENVTWRWSFWINLPIGALSMGIILLLLKSNPVEEKVPFMEQINRLDPIGTAVFVPSITCLLLALQWGGTEYEWSNWRIILLLVLFAVSFIAFIAIQIWKQENATMVPRIVRQRSIAFGMFFAATAGGAMMLFVYYLPIWFQAIQGVDATESGIRLIPTLISLFVGAMLAGIVIRFIGYYTPFMYASSVIMSIGAGLLTLITPSSGSGVWIGFQILYGFGLGMGMQQPNLAAQAVLDRKDVPVGTSMVMFAQILGGSIFISVGQNNFANELVKGLTAIPGKTFDTQTVVHTGATDIRKVVDADMLPAVLSAYNEAIVQVFYVAVGLAAATIIGAAGMEWVSTRKEIDAQKEKEKQNGEESA